MKDKLFIAFASPVNLKTSFGFIKSEVKKNSLPLDPFWTPGISAIETLGDALTIKEFGKLEKRVTRLERLSPKN
ncbi:hypothetical protein A2955_05265 [Candidatus Woesebacteria bacterium RIFCSPLOWO2_01_FULL_37_19]|uniref:Uncharacterized protein n=2 Tax=Candidatus Woeseibacteriota TaxID=1752722 RepID=A0A1F8B0I6_9BACT|nr:MAG: hypothetical protein A2771_01395 [Candidatus Woesebacteria bacterium RIFCSPHIGHO2_01_FULL_38_26b]OGM56995.1 MAG: hypothetical protein A2955_05265 [Candidatus Woesebacteria bacterium RIFCSPLOWO2_01_FULL_37_19]